MRTKTILLGLVLTLPWLVVFFLINRFAQSIFLGDECQYHSGETSWVFDLFYDLPAYNGYHPWPSVFNFTLTMIFPALYFGYRSAKRFFKTKNACR